MSHIPDSGRGTPDKAQLLLELLLANESLSDERDFIEAVLEVADVLVIVVDRNGRVVRFNRACEEASGYSADEVVGKVAWDVLVPPDQVPLVKAAFETLAGGSAPTHLRNEWLRRDGCRVAIEWSNTMLRGVGGEVKFVIGTGLDRTRCDLVELELERSEVRLQAIIDAAVEGILVVGENERIDLANPALCRMLGYERGELIGKPFDILIPDRFRERHHGLHLGFFEDGRPRSMAADLGIRALRKDGTELPIGISLGLCEIPAARCAVALISDQSQAERHRLELQRGRDEVRRLAGSLLTAEMDEDRRIARELHDGLVQDLAALAVEIGVLARQRPSKAVELERELRRLESTAKTMAERARDWSHGLHPATVENLGLTKSIQALCKSIARQSGLPIQFHLDRPAPDLSPQEATCLYRIAQEALRNAVRHSGASRIDVRLNNTEEGLSMEIEDEGRGFDPAVARPGVGLGLISMEERARLIGASVEVITRPGDGTVIRVFAPRPEGEP